MRKYPEFWWLCHISTALNGSFQALWEITILQFGRSSCLSFPWKRAIYTVADSEKSPVCSLVTSIYSWHKPFKNRPFDLQLLGEFFAIDWARTLRWTPAPSRNSSTAPWGNASAVAAVHPIPGGEGMNLLRIMAGDPSKSGDTWLYNT